MRIWVYYKEGIVRIKVPAEAAVVLSGGNRTEEGFRYVSESYFLTRDRKLACVVKIEESDCDGFQSSTRKFVAIGEQPMNSISKDGEIIPLEEIGPVWVRASQVD